MLCPMRSDLLERKIARLVLARARERRLSEEQALALFYSTPAYQQLTDPRTGLYLMSDGYILDDIHTQLGAQVVRQPKE